MRILLTEKVSNFIDELPVDKIKIIIERLNEIKSKSSSEIKALKETVDLSQKDESIEFFAYYLMDATYAVFAFKDNKKIIIVDLIELKDNKIKSFTLTPQETEDKPESTE